MKLEPGCYWGEQLVQREAEGVLLTLCHYGPHERLPRHSHALPGFFFLLSGDHLETNSLGCRRQPASSLLFHAADSPHETSVGPAGMVGLNIAFQFAGTGGAEMVPPARRDGWLLEKPGAKARALRLLAQMANMNGPETLSLGIELLELLEPCQDSPEAHPPRWLARVRERIETEYMQPLSLTVLADEAGVHPVYLARAFRHSYRCSVTELLHHVRLLQAIARYSAGMSLGEAAVECGFCDQAYLARVARSRLGVAPTRLNWFRSSKRRAVA